MRCVGKDSKVDSNRRVRDGDQERSTTTNTKRVCRRIDVCDRVDDDILGVDAVQNERDAPSERRSNSGTTLEEATVDIERGSAHGAFRCGYNVVCWAASARNGLHLTAYVQKERRNKKFLAVYFFFIATFRGGPPIFLLRARSNSVNLISFSFHFI